MEFVQPPNRRILNLKKISSNTALLESGPSKLHPRIILAMSSPEVGHTHKEFLDVMDDIIAGLQYLFQTFNSLTIAISGTCYAGMEAAFTNLVEEGDRVLILNNGGICGERAKKVAWRYGSAVEVLESPEAEVFSLSIIEEGLRAFKPDVLFVCHGNPSTGSCQPLRGIGDLCHRYHCLLLVDAVASLGGVPFFMDKWSVDVVYSDSQKVLGAPGTAAISFSPRARERMSRRKTRVKCFDLDMGCLAHYWGVEGHTRTYHPTGPVSDFYGLREALAIVAEEGLLACWRRHRECSESLWKGLEEVGLEMCIKDKEVRLPTLTTIRLPNAMYGEEVISYLIKKYDIDISGELWPQSGKVWSVGLMGYNFSMDSIRKILAALKEVPMHQERLRARL